MSEAIAFPDQKQIFKVALASIVGSVIEQYDFLVTGVSAATVWGGIFFKVPGLAAVAAAITVYGLGIIIRLVGALIFGHIADRRGRRDAVVYALVLMGVATLSIGQRRPMTVSGSPRGITDRVSAVAGYQFRRGVRRRIDLGCRASGAIEIPRLLGRLRRICDSDRAAARLRLGYFHRS
jgi:hypothetical protein